MSNMLTRRWVDEVLVPEIERINATDHVDSQETELYSQETELESQETEVAGPSWASNPPETLTSEQRRILEQRKLARGDPTRPKILLLANSWGGHSSDQHAEDLLARGIFELRIPKHTTARLQPLDVQVFRQYKIFVKRITEAASHLGIVQQVIDRYGIIRMHSVIWDQLHAPVYRDMLLWAWRNTDPDFSEDELTYGAPPRMVLDVQFGFNRTIGCETENCSARAFIRCAHCGKHLCLNHFLNRTCIHSIEHNQTEHEHINSTSSFRDRNHDHDHDNGSSGGTGAVIGTSLTGAALGVGVGIAGASATAGGASSAAASMGGSARC